MNTILGTSTKKQGKIMDTLVTQALMSGAPTKMTTSKWADFHKSMKNTLVSTRKNIK